MQVAANEEVDPAVLVRLLRQEVKDLKEEIRCVEPLSPPCHRVPHLHVHAVMHAVLGVSDVARPCRLLKATPDNAKGTIAAQQYTDLSIAMAAFLADPSPDACLNCVSDMRLIR